MTIFPFLIGYNDVCTWILDITQGTPVSTDICVISFIIINFINIWFIITLLKLIITTFKKIIKIAF